MLGELHHGAVKTMNKESGFRRRVHGHPADLANVGKGKNICEGVAVIPYLAQIREVAHHAGVLVPPVREGSEHMRTVPNVGEHVRVLENGYRRLGV